MERAAVIRELERLVALNERFARRRPGEFDAEAEARAFAYRYARDLLVGDRGPVLDDDDAVTAYHDWLVERKEEAG